MVKYYYDKYSTVWSDTAEWIYQGKTSSTSSAGGSSTYTNYAFNSGNNRYATAGNYLSIPANELSGYVYAVKMVGNESILSRFGGSSTNFHWWTKSSLQNTGTKGTLVQANIQAEDGTYPSDGIHTDGYWYVKTIAVNNAPSIPGPITSPASGTTLVQGAEYNFQWGASTDPDGNTLTYYPEYRVNGGTWVALSGDASLNRNITIPSNAISLDFRVRAFDGTAYSPYQNSVTYTVVLPNAIPTITLSTADNQTLYENNPFIINGSASDADNGDTVLVKYKINSGTSETIVASVSDGSAINYSKTLTFKEGKMFDGTRAVSADLAEGVPHTLTVWSEDDRGGKSANVTRTFTVVPNRAPGLIIDTFTTVSNQINYDTITITGAVTDPEAGNVTVTYALNDGAPVEIHNGAPGNWSIPLQLKSLKTGDNKVVIEATDNFGAKTIKTINKLTKASNAVPLKNSTAMWKITPPVGSATEVLAWIQREIGDLAVDAKISMTNVGEQENFVPLTLNESAPIDETITEDEFHYLDAAAKTNIVLKLNISRTDVNSDKSIKLVSGVLD
jgi:hypothetical protein